MRKYVVAATLPTLSSTARGRKSTAPVVKVSKDELRGQMQKLESTVATLRACGRPHRAAAPLARVRR